MHTLGLSLVLTSVPFYLVRPGSRQAADSALDGTGGLVQVGLQSRVVVGRHVDGGWLELRFQRSNVDSVGSG